MPPPPGSDALAPLRSVAGRTAILGLAETAAAVDRHVAAGADGVCIPDDRRCDEVATAARDRGDVPVLRCAVDDRGPSVTLEGSSDPVPAALVAGADAGTAIGTLVTAALAGESTIVTDEVHRARRVVEVLARLHTARERR